MDFFTARPVFHAEKPDRRSLTVLHAKHFARLPLAATPQKGMTTNRMNPQTSIDSFCCIPLRRLCASMNYGVVKGQKRRSFADSPGVLIPYFLACGYCAALRRVNFFKVSSPSASLAAIRRYICMISDTTRRHFIARRWARYSLPPCIIGTLQLNCKPSCHIWL